jgi:hypothetical protein
VGQAAAAASLKRVLRAGVSFPAGEYGGKSAGSAEGQSGSKEGRSDSVHSLWAWPGARSMEGR